VIPRNPPAGPVARNGDRRHCCSRLASDTFPTDSCRRPPEGRIRIIIETDAEVTGMTNNRWSVLLYANEWDVADKPTGRVAGRKTTIRADWLGGLPSGEDGECFSPSGTMLGIPRPRSC
jgi:hypothetical protein